VTFKVQEGNLYCLTGDDKVKLAAHSPTEFTSNDRMFTFYLNSSGKPEGVEVLGRFGVEYMPINDQPGDKPGPNKPGWQEDLGEYTGKSHEHIFKATVSVKNGHLYISWQGDLRLTEYKPGLFFTADGEAVNFQGDLMLLGNRRFLREKKP
jgi:hypothetical protein